MTRLLPIYPLLKAILYIYSAQTREFEIADRYQAGAPDHEDHVPTRAVPMAFAQLPTIRRTADGDDLLPSHWM
jgi:hypothetical protein